MANIVTPPGALTLPQWIGALRIDLSQDIIPLLPDTEGWRTWGNYVVGFGSFSKAGCPRTDGFSTWQMWGNRVFQCLNG